MCPPTSVATNEQRNSDDRHHCRHQNPERQDDIQNCSDRKQRNQPSQSVAPDETAFHDADIDRSTDVS